jgi:hypothetical protein
MRAEGAGRVLWRTARFQLISPLKFPLFLGRGGGCAMLSKIVHKLSVDTSGGQTPNGKESEVNSPFPEGGFMYCPLILFPRVFGQWTKPHLGALSTIGPLQMSNSGHSTSFLPRTMCEAWASTPAHPSLHG